MRHEFHHVMLLCIAFLFTACAEDREPGTERVESFPLQEVRLLDGPFKHACDLDVRVLLQYDTDRMLAPFRREAGLPKKAEVFPQLGRHGRPCERTLSERPVDGVCGDG